MFSVDYWAYGLLVITFLCLMTPASAGEYSPSAHIGVEAQSCFDIVSERLLVVCKQHFWTITKENNLTVSPLAPTGDQDGSPLLTVAEIPTSWCRGMTKAQAENLCDSEESVLHSLPNDFAPNPSLEFDSGRNNRLDSTSSDTNVILRHHHSESSGHTGTIDTTDDYSVLSNRLEMSFSPETDDVSHEKERRLSSCSWGQDNTCNDCEQGKYGDKTNCYPCSGSCSVSTEAKLKGVVGSSNTHTSYHYNVTLTEHIQFSGGFRSGWSSALWIKGKLSIYGGVSGTKTELKRSSGGDYRILGIAGGTVHLQNLKITNGKVYFFSLLSIISY